MRTDLIGSLRGSPTLQEEFQRAFSEAKSLKHQLSKKVGARSVNKITWYLGFITKNLSYVER